MAKNLNVPLVNCAWASGLVRREVPIHGRPLLTATVIVRPSCSRLVLATSTPESVATTPSHRLLLVRHPA